MGSNVAGMWRESIRLAAWAPVGAKLAPNKH